MNITKIILFMSVSIMPLNASYITRDTLKKYEEKLMQRINKIKTGLEYRWWLSWIPSTSAIVKLSDMAGETVTPTEWDMFPIFEGFDSKTLSQKFQNWFQNIIENDNDIQAIDNLLAEGKKQKCTNADQYNLKILHAHTAKDLFSSSELTIDEVNKKIKNVSFDTYQNEMFLRITCDSLYRELVLTVQS